MKFYTVRVENHRVLVYANNPIAKQVLWGWGSDRSQEEGSFYGNMVPGMDKCAYPDWAEFKWVLNNVGVELMVYNIVNYIQDRDYYSRKERKPALELLRKLLNAQDELDNAPTKPLDL